MRLFIRYSCASCRYAENSLGVDAIAALSSASDLCGAPGCAGTPPTMPPEIPPETPPTCCGEAWVAASSTHANMVTVSLVAIPGMLLSDPLHLRHRRKSAACIYLRLSA